MREKPVEEEKVGETVLSAALEVRMENLEECQSQRNWGHTVQLQNATVI